LLTHSGSTLANYNLSLNGNGELVWLRAEAQSCHFALHSDAKPIRLNTVTEVDIIQESCGPVIRSEPPMFQYIAFVYIECTLCGKSQVQDNGTENK
jgi:hypothetical protein